MHAWEKPVLRLDPANAPTAIAPAFQPVEALVGGFALTDFNDPARARAYADALDLWPHLAGAGEPTATDPLAELRDGVEKADPLGPVLGDLCRLHWLALRRRSVSVLEFGSGFSTVILAHAMRLLAGHFDGWARRHLRTEQPFHVHAVEEDPRYQALTRERLGPALQPHATVTRSSVELITHDNRFATVYSELPNIAPDLIYLDGPSQFATTARLNGFSIASPERMPMSADILRLEFFLEPGCVLIVDGRTQNARFLRSYFRRAWAYHHDRAGDIHLFELQEEPLGPINQRRLDFSLSQGWLL
ncbi:hypothetical protein GWI72_07725 [Microvirga tunisiensis]|uniref:Uncharacterized protein n=1 Tax=Pannonibacter tanglangensis TaxID=2750084 RepID=A0A7X5J949_9HYPH|nr:hypothetical protein [Pannonibacter sp. XCT-53]NBN78151.1 hypothetical protein [Pannonibacter sp. XCT-53]